MNRIKTICFIADGYPSKYRELMNAFVENLVNAMADQGIRCVVIAPQSYTEAIKIRTKLLPYKRERKTPGGNSVMVYTPKYISTSAKKIGPLNTSVPTLRNFTGAAERAFKDIIKTEKIDAVYGHFLNKPGIAANHIGKKYNIPAFFAFGENGTYSIDYLGDDKTREKIRGISGAIAVSSVNKQILLDKKLVPEDRIAVFPNAVDSRTFYKEDRLQIRKKLGYPQDAFIVAFSGRFLDVKGPLRLAEAIDRLQNKGYPIYSIFIGEGAQDPDCKNILFKGVLPHDRIREYLNASDVYVLPTLAEGCCNAIIEAMACGLPIISSDRPFNKDIIDAACAIEIDPTDVDSIESAVMTLYNDPELRAKLAAGAFQKAQNMKIENRAVRILDFMERMMNHDV